MVLVRASVRASILDQKKKKRKKKHWEVKQSFLFLTTANNTIRHTQILSSIQMRGFGSGSSRGGRGTGVGLPPMAFKVDYFTFGVFFVFKGGFLYF